jgi:hypothetical protein
MTDSRECAAIQEKHPAYLMVRDADDDRKQQLNDHPRRAGEHSANSTIPCRKEVTLKHIVGCCSGVYQSCPSSGQLPLHRAGQTQGLGAINIKQSRFDGRKATMVRPRLAENRMHPAA